MPLQERQESRPWPFLGSPRVPSAVQRRMSRLPVVSPSRCLAVLALVSGSFACASQNQPAKPALPPSLVLAGGTLIDVTDWGRSANDIPDSVIFIRDGRILSVGTRATLPIPKGARVIDCTGKYLVPGLIDGFAGMNSQGQAKANLYMGVTTVVASSDDRRGHIDTCMPTRALTCTSWTA